jgi:ribonuclease HI
MPIDADAILLIKPSRRFDEDVLAWHPEPSGMFSVRSAYKIGLTVHADQCAIAESSCQTSSSWRKIWRAGVPPKVKTFAWKAASNALATESNKVHRHMRGTSHCKICGSDVEDVAHALYDCPHARRLWEEMKTIWCLPADADLQGSPFNWFQALLTQIPDHMVDTTLLVAWRAWFARNEGTHDKPLPPIEGSKRFLASYLKMIQNSKDSSTESLIKGKNPMLDIGTSRPRKVKKPPDIPWVFPPFGCVKLTVDGSFRSEDKSAGIGLALCDADGMPIFTACRFLRDCNSPLEAELRACAEGLELALQQSELPVIIKTDCSQLAVVVSSPGQNRSPLLHFVSQIKFLASQRSECSFVKVERSHVRVSHDLANLARLENLNATWLGTGPDAVSETLGLDRLVIPPA